MKMHGTVNRCSRGILPGSVLALILVLGGTGTANAQDAVIDGAVTDATGLVLPGVTVEVRSAAAGRPVATAVTDGAGAFAIAGLRPGTYDVRFILPGFHEVLRSGVEAAAGAAVTLEVELVVELEEQVVVVGSRARPRSV
ncbi:MAG: carboxypeptidase-like regulatory domain-containing protein, partial [Acidobacteriota bacterium]|nr:carboxypeptidase-like regulatory domain-containing protein [Acidobacteriota bacterium]